MDYCKALISFILLCSSHKNRKISSNTFSYWNFLHGEASTSNEVSSLLKNSGYEFVAEAYLELFHIVIQNCKAKSLKILSLSEVRKSGIGNVNSDAKELFEEDNQLSDAFSDENTTLQDYRVLAQDTFYNCCNMITMLKGAQGMEALFSLIIPSITEDYIIKHNLDLNQPKIRTEYILHCEAILFSARSVLDFLNRKTSAGQLDRTVKDIIKAPSENINFGDFDKYIIEIIKRIVMFPQESILVRSCLYFIKESKQKLKKCVPESLDEILTYCLNIDDFNLIEAKCEVKSNYSFFKHLVFFYFGQSCQ